ncbi:hypothetical protein Nmel_001608, partial [Mimus melanotis]
LPSAFQGQCPCRSSWQCCQAKKLEKLQLSRALVKAKSALRSCPAASAYQCSQVWTGKAPV